MKVLIVNHAFRRTDGQGRVNAEAAAHLLKQGHGVTLAGAEVPDDLAQHPGCTVYKLNPNRHAPTQLLRHLTFGWRSTRAIWKLQAHHDVVIANGGMTFSKVDVNICHFVHAGWHRNTHHPLRAAFRRRPFWAVYQYLYTMQAIAWERCAYRNARRVVAVSDLVQDQLVNTVGVMPERIEVIENGMDASGDTSCEARAKARTAMKVTDEQFVLFFAGELRTARKNLDVLLGAMTKLPAHVVLVAAGAYDGGPYATRVREMGLTDRVKLLGFRKDVRELYVGGDVFALFSHYEPFGLVVTEAMAAGVPVLTSKSVGASPVVKRYQAGLVVEDHESCDEVAGAILKMLGDATFRTEAGSHGMHAQDQLCWERTGQRYTDLVASLVDQMKAESELPELTGKARCDT